MLPHHVAELGKSLILIDNSRRTRRLCSCRVVRFFPSSAHHHGAGGFPWFRNIVSRLQFQHHILPYNTTYTFYIYIYQLLIDLVIVPHRGVHDSSVAKTPD